MKNTRILTAILTITLVFSMAACGDGGGSGNGGGGGGGGGSTNPDSKNVKWTQGSTDYELAMTAEISPSSNNIMYNISVGSEGYSGDYESALKAVSYSSSKYKYILSVGTSGHSVGTVTVSGNTYTFAPHDIVGGSSFSITINGTKVTSAGASIKLVNDSGTASSYTLPATDATVIVTNTTGGVGTNPFVGNWSCEYPYNGQTLHVNTNVTKGNTWSCTVEEYPNQVYRGSYAYIGNRITMYGRDVPFGVAFGVIITGTNTANFFDGIVNTVGTKN